MQVWLVEDHLYLSEPEGKTLRKARVADLGWLAAWFTEQASPLLLVQDAEQRRQCLLRVTNMDRWYTYVALGPGQKQRSGWFSPANISRGQLALVNAATRDIPKAMPRQLWFEQPNGNTLLFDIRRWRQDVPGAVREEDLRPTLPPGWRLVDLDEILRPLRPSTPSKSQPESRGDE
jgi:hypothetical protein